MSRVWMFGQDVDTDQIVPGRYAPYMRPGEELGDAAFIEARPEFASDAEPGDIIIAAQNFGCGSSREYAPLALKRRGIAAIIAPSFARIFFRNGINLGMRLYELDLTDRLKDGDDVVFDPEGHTLFCGGMRIELPAPAGFVEEIISAGGIAAYVRKNRRFPELASHAD